MEATIKKPCITAVLRFLRGAFLTSSAERLNGIQEVSGSIPLISIL